MAQQYTHFCFLIFSFFGIIATSADPQLDNVIPRDVYTGRQLNDIMTSSLDVQSAVATVAGVLVMYSSKCEDEMTKTLNIKRQTLPSDHFLVVMRHNYEKYHETVWYESDEEDNLYNRYMSEDDPCMKLLFWKAGAQLSQPETMTAGLELVKVIWLKFFTQLKVINELSEDISLKVTIPGGQVAHGVDIKAKSQAGYHSFISLLITVFNKENGRFLYGELCNSRSQTGTITISTKLLQQFSETYRATKDNQGLVDLDKWNKYILRRQQSLAEYDNVWRITLEKMYLNTLVFPAYIPSYSLTGHETVEMESDLFVPLERFAKSDTVGVGMTKESGQFTKEPVINNREEATSVIPVSDSTRKILITSVKPEVERFVGCYVHITSAVLRHLKASTIIRDHVDTHDNHVITVFLVLGDVSKPQAENVKGIEIGLVDIAGERKTIKLYPGHMLLYESKTTIFSMRQPLKQSNPYTVVEAYFEPSKNWPWKYFQENDTNVLTNGDDVKVMMGRSWPNIKQGSQKHTMKSHKKYGVEEDPKGTLETDPVTNEKHMEL